MSFLRKEEKMSVVTPTPAGLSRETLLSNLHDHERIILLSPDHGEHSLLKGDPQSSATYTVTDYNVLGKTVYELTLTNREDGADTEVTSQIPLLGLLKMWTSFRVVEEGGDLVLQEDMRIEGNRIVVGMVKGSLEKTQTAKHLKLMEGKSQDVQ